MRLVFKNLSTSSLPALTATVLLLAACSGGGGGSVGPNPPPPPPGPTSCITNPVPESLLPTGNVGAADNPGDQIFHNYTNPGNGYTIYGYANPNSVHVKFITIFNNYSNVIYPVLYSPTPHTSSDGQLKNMSRIYVGSPSCADKSTFYAGIPPGGTAKVYIPKQMWANAHVKLFTEVPQFKQEDTGISSIVAPRYTIDTAANSPNRGFFLYTSGTPDDFAQELPFQLTEYTIESNCNDDNTTCVVDKLTVDYDKSAVDQLMLPLAMQESTGSRGFVGTGMSVQEFQGQLLNFAKGATGVSYSSQVGWPYYYGSEGISGYKNNLIKVPMGYFTINSLLFPSPSPFNRFVGNLSVYSKATFPPTPVDDAATLSLILNNIQTRWTNFWGGNVNCAAQQDPAFCQNFTNTMTFLRNNVVNACQFALVDISLDPNLCLTRRGSPADPPVNPRSVLTDIDKIQKLVGYNFPGNTFSNPGGTYPPTDTTSISCTVQFGPLPPANGQFYSNCFRDALKSVLRGVPYPFWKYEDKFYPEPSSVYSLNPAVWFAHKQLGLSLYAFSVDDDIGNQEAVGTGFNIAIGGLKGLISTNEFSEGIKQILAFPGGTVNPFWTGTVQGTTANGTVVPFPACIPGQVGGCDINVQAGGFASVTVALKGIANPAQTMTFTISPGTPKQCTVANPVYTYTPLVISSCTASPGLQNCSNPGLLPVTFNNPGVNCAQTVSPSQPTP